MNYLKTAAFAVLGTLALTAGASAAVICNDDGDCWRTKESRLTYPPKARVQIYGDDYTLGPKYRWREARAGRGYYRGGVWVGFYDSRTTFISATCLPFADRFRDLGTFE